MTLLSNIRKFLGFEQMPSQVEVPKPAVQELKHINIPGNPSKIIDEIKAAVMLPVEPEFTQEEIDQLKQTVMPSARRSGRTLWMRAFQFYNKHHRSAMVNPMCSPCYQKVLTFILQTHKSNG